MILPCQYGYYTIEDKEGKPLIVLRTKDDTPYYRISYNSRYGLMDFEGNVLTPCKYEKIGAFTDGNLAHVILNDKVGYIDSNGKRSFRPYTTIRERCRETGMRFIKTVFVIWWITGQASKSHPKFITK